MILDFTCKIYIIIIYYQQYIIYEFYYSRLKYVDAYLKFELEDSIDSAFESFKDGFLLVYRGKVLVGYEF